MRRHICVGLLLLCSVWSLGASEPTSPPESTTSETSLLLPQPNVTTGSARPLTGTLHGSPLKQALKQALSTLRELERLQAERSDTLKQVSLDLGQAQRALQESERSRLSLESSLQQLSTQQTLLRQQIQETDAAHVAEVRSVRARWMVAAIVSGALGATVALLVAAL